MTTAPDDMIENENYLPRYLNQAITFSIEDIGGDEAGAIGAIRAHFA